MFFKRYINKGKMVVSHSDEFYNAHNENVVTQKNLSDFSLYITQHKVFVIRNKLS